MSLVAIALLVSLSTVAACLVGLAAGRRLRGTVSDAERTQMYGLQASLLGLLALLLGFSFAMGETRLDLRKQFALDEANAIGTARLRAAGLEEPRGDEIARLLEQYVDVRVRGYASRDPARLRGAIRESERLQEEAWTRTAALARDNPSSLPAALLVQSMNQVIDLHASRVAAARNRIPGPVLATLLVVAVITLGWVGVCVGLSTRRGLLPTLLLALLIALVLVVVIDLDQPRGGLIRAGQAALVELQRSFR